MHSVLKNPSAHMKFAYNHQCQFSLNLRCVSKTPSQFDFSLFLTIFSPIFISNNGRENRGLSHCDQP